jgi:hypothetical protein
MSPCIFRFILAKCHAHATLLLREGKILSERAEYDTEILHEKHLSNKIAWFLGQDVVRHTKKPATLSMLSLCAMWNLYLLCTLMSDYKAE